MQVHVVMKSDYWDGCNHNRIDRVYHQFDDAKARAEKIIDEKASDWPFGHERAAAWVFTADVH